MKIGHGLRFHALRGIDHQHSAFTSGEGTRDFVGEVHVAGGVDEVEFVSLPIFRLVGHRHRVRFDGDTLFAFEVHRVEQLVLFFAMRDGIGGLEEAVGKRSFTVIDVSDDREISGEFNGHGEAMNGWAGEARR